MDRSSAQEALLDLLLRSLDETLPQAEQAQLDQALREKEWLRTEQQQLLQLRQGLRGLKGQPQAGFVDQLLHQLPARVRLFSLQRLWPVAIAASLVAAVATAGWIYTSSGGFDKAAIIGLDELEIEDVYALGEY